MEYVYIYDGKKIDAVLFKGDDKVSMRIDITYDILTLSIANKKKYNRKKIDVFYYLNEVINFLNENNYFIEQEKKYIDIFNKENIKFLRIKNLKLEDKDIQTISRFNNLMTLETTNCTFYKNCNLGILKCDILDTNSVLYTLDSLNGFAGNCIKFRKTHIVRPNKNVLHLYNQVLVLLNININYELFFLTTDAPNLRRLNINRYHESQLKDNDLLFISGFYNLEACDIAGIIDSYDQFDKLEKLRELKNILIKNIGDNYKNNKYYQMGLNENLSKIHLANILHQCRLSAQNKYLQLRHILYIPRLERVQFANNIENKNDEEVRDFLVKFNKKSYQEKKSYLREPQKKLTPLDLTYDLFFDTILEDDEDDYYLVNSQPSTRDGINYYRKKERIKKI